MRIYLGSDHAGFELKGVAGRAPDRGRARGGRLRADSYEPEDDYPPYCIATAQRVVADPGSLGDRDRRIGQRRADRGEQGAPAARRAGLRPARPRCWPASTTTPTCSASARGCTARRRRCRSPTRSCNTEFSHDPRHVRRIGMLAAYEQTGALPRLESAAGDSALPARSSAGWLPLAAAPPPRAARRRPDPRRCGRATSRARMRSRRGRPGTVSLPASSRQPRSESRPWPRPRDRPGGRRAVPGRRRSVRLPAGSLPATLAAPCSADCGAARPCPSSVAGIALRLAGTRPAAGTAASRPDRRRRHPAGRAGPLAASPGGRSSFSRPLNWRTGRSGSVRLLRRRRRRG